MSKKKQDMDFGFGNFLGVKDSELGKQMTELVKEQIEINPELEAFIRPLSENEYSLLQASILKEGCREPLKIWHHEDKYILIDGHHRYTICKNKQLDFNYELLEFDSIVAVKDYMIRLQMGRRNLTQQEVSYYRGTQYNLYKSSVGVKAEEKLNPSVRNSAMVAHEHGVGEKTIRRDAQVAEVLDAFPKYEHHKYLSGESDLTKGELEQMYKDLGKIDEEYLKSFRLKVAENKLEKKAIQKEKVAEKKKSSSLENKNEVSTEAKLDRVAEVEEQGEVSDKYASFTSEGKRELLEDLEMKMHDLLEKVYQQENEDALDYMFQLLKQTKEVFRA